MKKYAIIGVAGYIAPKHLEAIYQTGGRVVAAYDPHDNVGILDKYFPDADFFTEFERFDRHLDKLRRKNIGIDYLVVCSPNYLHDAHCRFGLRMGVDVICEKPLALRPYNVQALIDLEEETGKKIYNILQLRLHPSIIALKEYVENFPKNHRFKIELTYITARGKWYHASWKSDISKSGGISTNIGIHFFDVLIWIFGNVEQIELHQKSFDREAGKLILERANVNWFLSIQKETLPDIVKKTGKSTYRSLSIDDITWEFSDGFTELHTKSYERILQNNGWLSIDTYPSIELTYQLRNMSPQISVAQHPFTTLPLLPHPFEQR